MKKRNIRRKITQLLLSMVLGVLLLIGGVSVLGLYSMKNISRESSMKLGQTAAMDAEEALEKMAGEQLLGLAVQKSAYIEEKFNAVIACVNGIAQEAESIYLNPESYPDREVALPVKGSRELAAQLLWSRRLAGVRARGILFEEDMGLFGEIRKLGNIQDLLVQYNKNNDMISSTYIATKSGWMIQADYIAYSKYSDDSDVADFYEANERQWYQRALAAKEGQTVYSDVIKDIHEGGDCIVCSRPVYLDGEIVAVAGVGSYLDTVNTAVLDTVIGKNGYAFLINEKGQVMVSGAKSGETAANSDETVSLVESLNTGLAKAAADMVSGKSALTKLTVDGREVYMAYAPLAGLGWSFVTVMDVEEVIAPARQSQQGILELTDTVSKQQNSSIGKTLLLFLVIMLIATVFICIASIIFTKKLTEPIRMLSNEVAQIDGGNLDRQIQISTGDEVEELGKAFNSMTAQLKSYIANLAAATAEKERIRTELDLASQIQADMLPDSEHTLTGCDGFKLCARMTPAKEVGGDFYDFFLIDDNHLAFMVADVSGKGIPASLFMVVARTLLHTRIKGGGTLEDVVTKVNDSLCSVNKNGMFVTAWIGILTISTGILTYVNAGHNPPLVGNKEGGYRYIKERSGLVLAGMDGVRYVQKEIKLEEGDTVFLYTDGVSEANNEEGKLYGEERLLGLLNDCRETQPETLIENVWEAVLEFQGRAEQFDDITMLAVKYQGASEKKEEIVEFESADESGVKALELDDGYGNNDKCNGSDRHNENDGHDENDGHSGKDEYSEGDRYSGKDEHSEDDRHSENDGHGEEDRHSGNGKYSGKDMHSGNSRHSEDGKRSGSDRNNENDGYSMNTGTAEICRIQEVQDFLEKALKDGQIPKKDIRKLLMASDEIFSNICHYSKAKIVTVGCRIDEMGAAMFFEDDGIAFNPLKKSMPNVNEPLEQRKVGGLGIYMVCEMMDEVVYRHKEGKNRLTIIKTTK